MTDTYYMKRALRLARRGAGRVSPNPMVGAVIVKDGRIIGEGYHKQYGGYHAERNALNSCTVDPRGADMYVTLEPCCHTGKQPPCTDAVISSGISRVFVGSLDPNPLVAGKGIDVLRASGVQVEVGILKEQCDAINKVFFHYIQTGLPYVIMKYAMTADGKIATCSGQSQWITGDAARRYVHKQRAEMSAVMVGVGTVLSDNPMLTCRTKKGYDPIRIVCDTHLRTPLDSNIVKTAGQVRTIIATCSDNEAAIARYASAGVEILRVGQNHRHIDLCELMRVLGSKKIDSIILEGGGTLNYAAVQSGIVNEVNAYVAPKIVGGKNAPSPVGGDGIASLCDAFPLKTICVKRLGDDLLIQSEVVCLPE